MKKVPPIRSLKYFILNSQSLDLYRQFIKTIHRIPDSQTQEQILKQVKDQYARYKNIQDIPKIQYLITTGRQQLKTLQMYTSR